MKVNRYIGKDSALTLELKRDEGIFAGNYLGIISRSARSYPYNHRHPDKKFYHYQFSGLLGGNKVRHLQLYIPLPTSENTVYAGIMEETEVPLEIDADMPAFFSVGAAVDLLGGSNVVAIVRERYGLKSSEARAYPVLIEWRGNENPLYGFSWYNAGTCSGMHPFTDGRLMRLQRDHWRPIKGGALYIVSIPFDIVTFPIQTVIWLHRGGPR
jgi:hypothetical protein